MGRKLDALFGRSFKASKFKTYLNLAISRLAILKNQRQVRCSQARSDVTQLLEMGQQERALLRVEHVIKEQNMFDAFDMMEGYCKLLIERLALIENHKDCPDELKEAISGLIFAASRCGEFPELQQIRDIFTSRFGKEFTVNAAELRNHCGVNPKMIQKMSTRQPSLENRLKVTKEIASEKGITLDIEEPFSGVTAEDLNMSQKRENQAKPKRSDARGNAENSINDSVGHDAQNTNEIDPGDQLSGSMKAGKKYADVASAAQAAFESAAQAAAAARAAVELSKSEPRDKGSDDRSGPDNRGRNRSYENRDDRSLRYRGGFGIATTEKVDHFTGGSDFDKIHPIQYSSSDSEDELTMESVNILPEEFKGESKAKLERSEYASSLDTTGVTLNETNVLNEADSTKPSGKAIHFDESDEETEKDWARIPFKPYEFHFDGENISPKEVNKTPRTSNRLSNTRRVGYGLGKNYEVSDENEGIKHLNPNQKQADSVKMQHEEFSKMESVLRNDGNPVAYHVEKHVQQSEIRKKPVSVRTRRGFK